MNASSPLSPLAQQLTKYLPPKANKWWLAVSGGLDSMCLMALMHELQNNSDTPLPPIAVIHINHGLQSSAMAWQTMVAQAANRFGFAYTAVIVPVDAQQQKAEGVESAARTARYQAFAQHVQACEYVLLAHHADDQAETLLLRLLRGTGIAGLGAMPLSRAIDNNATTGQLWRPLLFISRQQLETYAQQHNVPWINDPSNQNTHHDRNFLRHQVLPMIKQRWPQMLKRTQTTVQLAQQSQILLNDLAQLDFQTASYQHTNVLDDGLAIDQLAALSQPRRANLLRWWLLQQTALIPSQKQLEQIDQQLINAAQDAQPRIVLGQGKAQICLYRDGNHCQWQLANQAKSWMPQTLTWPPSTIPKPIDADTIAMGEKPQWAIAHGTFKPKQGGLKLQAGDVLAIRQRQGGERCRPANRAHSQTLKKLLQEYKVPVTKRDSLPLFYVNGELAMVAHLWVCHGYNAPAQQWGWQWQAEPIAR